MVNDGKEAASGRMTEAHPLEPFLPEGARLLMLGSFPPARSRWSMEFYYPNFQNDMWRVMGLVFYGDRERFVAPDGRHFDREAVETFCRERGIALSDTAAEVVRARGNASDRFLEVVRPFDLAGMLERLPACRAVAATGQKAADTLGCSRRVRTSRGGLFSEFEFSGRMVRFYRMPSTSRALSQTVGRKGGRLREDVRRNGTCLLKDVLWGRRRASEPRPDAESRRADGRGCRPFGKGMFCRIVIFYTFVIRYRF